MNRRLIISRVLVARRLPCDEHIEAAGAGLLPLSRFSRYSPHQFAWLLCYALLYLSERDKGCWEPWRC